MIFLLGCAWLGDAEIAALRDGDADKVPVWEDCDDADPAVGAETEGYVDADGDGVGGAPGAGCPGAVVTEGGDCDDADPAVGRSDGWWPDADGDSYASPDGGTEGCDAPDATWLPAAGTDCDDADAAVHPDAPEVCENATDDDCDDAIDECDLASGGVLLAGTVPSGGFGSYGLVFVDADADGRDELVVAAPWANTVEAFAVGDAAEDPTWEVDDLSPAMGSALAIGDLDGDGVIDLAIGASESEFGGVGLAYGPLLQADQDDDFISDVFDGGLGAALSVTDLDADGVDDLAIGAPTSAGGCGATWLVYGPVTAAAQTVDALGRAVEFTLACDSPTPEGGLGQALVFVTGGDGGPALAMGQANANGQTGAVLLWRGDADTGSVDLANDPDTVRWDGEAEYDLAGSALDTGDLDGDGRPDLVVGAPFYSDDTGSRGAVYVLSGVDEATGGDLDDAVCVILGEPAEGGALAGFGASLAVLSGAARDALTVGAPVWTSAARGPEAGAVYTFHDALSGTIDATDATARLYGDEEHGNAGWRLAAGDADGDGETDVAVGIPGWDDPAVDAGAVVVLFGGRGE